MRIGKLAENAGMGIETIRFYHREGLLEMPQSHEGTYREYGQEHLAALNFIKHAKDAGFSLKNIKELLALDAKDDRALIRKMASQRAKQLEQELLKITKAKGFLEQLIEQCRSESLDGPCPIKTSFTSR